MVACAKINIDYYIKTILDDDVIDEIYTYFKEDAETDSIKEAMEELSDSGYSEEEVRLIRIKFMSEMGN